MFSGKTLVVYGPRQAGKTTAVENYIARHQLEGETLTFNGDESADREMLADISADRLKLLVGCKRIRRRRPEAFQRRSRTPIRMRFAAGFRLQTTTSF